LIPVPFPQPLKLTYCFLFFLTLFFPPSPDLFFSPKVHGCGGFSPLLPLLIVPSFHLHLFDAKRPFPFFFSFCSTNSRLQLYVLNTQSFFPPLFFPLPLVFRAINVPPYSFLFSIWFPLFGLYEGTPVFRQPFLSFSSSTSHVIQPLPACLLVSPDAIFFYLFVRFSCGPELTRFFLVSVFCLLAYCVFFFQEFCVP